VQLECGFDFEGAWSVGLEGRTYSRNTSVASPPKETPLEASTHLFCSLPN
jgi:hypothetical protein